VVFREMPERISSSSSSSSLSLAFPTEFISVLSSNIFSTLYTLLLISWINCTTPPSKIMRRKRRLFCRSKSNSLQPLMRSFAYDDETINALSLYFIFYLFTWFVFSSILVGQGKQKKKKKNTWW
jgi:hypothetical protein